MAERRDTQVHELIQERDTLKDAYVQASLTNRGGTPGSEPKKSTKMADPEPLSDGQEPKYEQWLSRMKNKLEANADHYPTEVAEEIWNPSGLQSESFTMARRPNLPRRSHAERNDCPPKGDSRTTERHRKEPRASSRHGKKRSHHEPSRRTNEISAPTYASRRLSSLHEQDGKILVRTGKTNLEEDREEETR
jgi:hypothetical protein